MTNAQIAYYSNLCSAWPIANQKENRPATIQKEYQDEVDRRFRRSPKLPKLLRDRASMLRPTTRNGGAGIWIMALPCIAINTPDLLDVLKLAKDRGEFIYVENRKLLITHKPDSWHKAVKVFEEDKQAGKLAERGSAGGFVSGANRRAKSEVRLKPFEPFWGDDSKTIAQMAEEAGTSINTFVDYMEKKFGTRSHAVKVARRKAKREGRAV